MSSFPKEGSRLVGHTIKRVSLDGSSLRFELEPGEPDVIWDVEGDCCSSSLFTDLKLNDVIGKQVHAVEDIEAMTDPRLDPENLSKQEQHDECEQIYGVVIHAGDSEGVVIHRNWSNGYYGGWLTEERLP